ncbi:MAG: TetR/AcrR family transcriptional regulator [Lentisphaeria bacterium]
MSRKATGTKDKLLHTACNLIVDRGYKGITLHEICSLTNANIASVNYYFGSKRDLYLQVWEKAHACLIEEFVDEDYMEKSVEEQLESYVDLRIMMVFSEGPSGWLARLAAHEKANPSEVADVLVKKYVKPKNDYLMKLLKSFLGEKADKIAIECALYCLSSQCDSLILIHEKDMFPFNKADMTDKGKEQIKNEIKKIILGSLYSYKESFNK